jgi:hypothetical protein
LDLTILHEYARTRATQLRNRIVTENLEIVDSTVRGFFATGEVRRRRAASRPVEYDDLYQAGVIGLMIGVEKYDPVRGVSLYIYAKMWVLSHVQDEYYRLQGSRRNETQTKVDPYDAAFVLRDGRVGDEDESHEGKVGHAIDLGRFRGHFTTHEIDVLEAFYDLCSERRRCAREGFGDGAARERWRKVAPVDGVRGTVDLENAARPLIERARRVVT